MADRARHRGNAVRYELNSVFVVDADDDDSGCQADAHFVLEGRCACVQRLRVRKTAAAFGRDRYAMVQTPTTAAADDGPGGNPRTIYVNISSDLRPGSVFGLGK